MADPFVITDEARAKAIAALYGGAPTTAAPFTITDEAREKARSVMGALVPDAQSRRLGAVASAYEQATPELDIDRVRQFGEQIGDIRDPSKLRLAAEHGAADRERLKAARGRLGEMIGLARRNGDEETAQRLERSAQSIYGGSAGGIGSKAWRAAKQTARTAFDVIDAPQHAIRQVTTSGYDPTAGARRVTTEEWLEKSKKAAAEGHPGHWALRKVSEVGAASPLTWPLIAGNVLASGAGALARGETPTLEMAKRAASDTHERAADLFQTLVTDPSMYLTAGASSLKNLAGPIMRMAPALGVSAQAAERIAQGVHAVSRASGGTKAGHDAMLQALERGLVAAGGAPKAVHAAIAKTFGEGAKYLGRGQLRVGIPFTDVGVDVARLGLPEFGGRKLVAGVAGKTLGPQVGAELFGRTGEFALVEARRARAQAAAMRGRGVESVEDLVRLARKENITKPRLDDLYAHAHHTAALARGVQSTAPAVAPIATRAEAHIVGEMARLLGKAAPKNRNVWGRLLEAIRADAAATSKTAMEGRLHAQFGAALPAPVRRVVGRTFDTFANNFGNFIRASFPSIDPNGALSKSLGLWTKTMDRYKSLALMPRLGYHMVNAFDDMAAMFQAGINLPMRDVLAANRIVAATKAKRASVVKIGTRTLSGDAFLRLAAENNIGVDALARLDFVGEKHEVEQLAKMMDRLYAGKSARNLVQKYEKLGAHLAGWWETRSKLAAFRHFLEKGHSPAEAATKTFEALIDYGDHNLPTKIARWFLPFATWAMKAPGSQLKLYAQSPARTLLLSRTVRAMADQPRH